MIRAFILLSVATGLALITLLFRASSNNAFFAEHYPWLFAMGIALIAGLLGLIGFQIYSLVNKLRGRVFGSKLALRLMAVFALMAVIPGGLVYAISVQFLNRSIDSWFDVPVDRALEGALNLGKSALDAALADLVRNGTEAAARMADRPLNDSETLNRLRIQYGFDEIALFSEDGKMRSIASAATSKARLLADKPNGLELRQAIRKLPVKVIETLSDRSLYLRAVIAVPFASSSDGLFALQVIMAVPKNLVADAQSVETGFRDYQQLGFQREGLKRLFALTLTLAMLLTLFSAIALSFLLSERLSSPLSALADATRAIARGDFTRLNPVKSRDEFGVLTQSFNTMTRQLREASDVVATKQQQLENANAYLESILGHLTSGVITLDARMYVKTINKNAEDMLGFEYQALQGVRLPEWGSALPQLKSLIGEIRTQLANMRERTWERQIAFEGPHGRRTLLVRATKLPANIDSGFVFVFDDITGLIQAQRDAAWGEVARRLAHEIKNPLTPIQLSAERLQQKLANKLPPLEQDLLTRATNTIVAQVGALKGMVDDFSLYSRSSRLAPVPLDFNELVRDVLVLYESTTVSISTNLAGDIPMLMADPALMRQVLHNLIQNALDACSGGSNPAVSISTRIADNWVMLGVDDNGSGVREDVMASIFEPYVTTKPKGTGLGLAIVKKIVDEHRGRISVSNVKPHGASVQICLPIEISALGTAVSLSRAQQVEQ